MRTSIAASDIWKLVALSGMGLGIMWALQALGFGPMWIIVAGAGAGASAGVAYVAATLRDDTQDETALVALPETA